MHRDVCKAASGLRLFVLSHRHVEYKTPLKEVKGEVVKRPCLTPSSAPFTELGVVLWKQLQRRACVNLRHGQDNDKSLFVL
jgi:hypothetical protein